MTTDLRNTAPTWRSIVQGSTSALAVGLALSLVLAACNEEQPAEAVNPCEGAPCADGELCAVGASDAVCVCPPGLIRTDGICAEPSAEGAQPNPCEGVDCGADGICAVASSGPVCLCGWGGVSLDGPCVPPNEPDVADEPDVAGGEEDTSAAHACEGVDCGGHGECVLTGAGNALCVCERGHHRRGGACVPTVDPCAEHDCGQGGACVPTRSGPVCLCGPGTVRAGDACEPAPGDSCAGIDCGNGGTCAPLASGPLCLCPPGAVRAGATSCALEANPCEGIDCSGLGTCVTNGSGAPVCLCQAGAISVGTACQPPPDGALPETVGSPTELAEPHPETGALYVPGELSVYAIEEHNPIPIFEVAAQYDAQVLSYFAPSRLYLVRTSELLDATAMDPLKQALLATGQVAFAMEQFVIGDTAGPVAPKAPDDPEWGAASTWFGSEVTGKNWYLKQIRAPEAWGYTTGSSDLRLGVVDAGPLLHLDTPHVPIGIGTKQPDSTNHALEVLGVAAARGHNGFGLTGVVWESHRSYCELGTDTKTLGNMLKCVHKLIDNDVRVINISQGTKFRSTKWCFKSKPWECPFATGSPPVLTQADQDWQQAVGQELADKAGKPWVIVTSSGNEALDDAEPASLILGIDHPKLQGRILGVAATTADGDLAAYSNRGDVVDLAAPGGDPNDTLMAVLAPAGTVSEWGTSLAAPLVSGTLALAWSIDPTLTPKQLTELVVQAAWDAGQTAGAYPIVDALGAVEAVIANCEATGRVFNFGTGQCTEQGCVPQCAGKVCGPDTCGGTCGELLGSTCEGDTLVACDEGATIVEVDCQAQAKLCGTGPSGFALCISASTAQPPTGSIYQPKANAVLSGDFEVKAIAYRGGAPLKKATLHISGPQGLVFNQSKTFDGDNDPAFAALSFPVNTQSWPSGFYTLVLWVADASQAVEAAKLSATVENQGVPGCTPVCGAKQCGSDGCGGVCGLCAGDQVCSPLHVCVGTAQDTDMLPVPAGYFWMGCNVTIDSCGSAKEQPFHQVYLDGFEVDRLETSNAEYAVFLNTLAGEFFNTCGGDAECVPLASGNGLKFGGGSWFPASGFEQHPAQGTSWFGAKDYCEWKGKRLCTEAEWEKAAIGPTGNIYPWGNFKPTCDYAQYFGCDGDTVPVGSKPLGASPYGALDMAGNVLEWCADWMGSSYYAQSPSSNPMGPESGSGRVARGGSFYDGATHLRASYRDYFSPSATHYYLGFRCCRSLP